MEFREGNEEVPQLFLVLLEVRNRRVLLRERRLRELQKQRRGVAVRGEQARKPRILRRKERGVGGARDAGNCVILKLSAIYAGILGVGYMAGKWLRE